MVTLAMYEDAPTREDAFIEMFDCILLKWNGR